jgi:group I intron endonuclease
MKHNQQRWGYIYKLTNKVNAKYYFGKTIHFKRRMTEHRRSAKKGKQYLARAIKKHGWENFNVEILIRDVPEEDLNHLERSYIEIYDSMNPKRGYNLTKGGDGMCGYVVSEETRKKLKKYQSKRKQFGSISFSRKKKVYTVSGPQINGKGTYVGRYDTKEEATNALNIFNTTGEKLKSTIKRRKGSIRKYKSRFYATYRSKYLGTYSSEQEAEEAINHFIQTGEKLKSTIQKRKGSIQKRKSHFYASCRHKYLGTYSSEQEAEEAIKKHLSTAHTATASTTTSV